MPRLRILRRLGVAALVVIGLWRVLVADPSALAQPLPPRPTPSAVPPTATSSPQPQPQPTATSAPAQPTATRTPKRHDSEPVLPGHLTGTVIDQRTGAPTAGVEVQVGTLFVISDANGNYDVTGLAPGQYAVALRLGADQGVASQAVIRVQIEAGQRVVQHLFWSSPAPAAPTSIPTPPTAPASLPATGGAEGAVALLAALGLLLMGAGVGLRRARR